MNTIIGLRGKGGTGKTTTIRLLHSLLQKNGYLLVSTTFKGKKGDFMSIFSKDKKRIGITSSGDAYKAVYIPLKEFIDNNCAICVCACRTYDRIRPGTNKAIVQFTNYRHLFIKKTVGIDVISENSSNHKDADILFSEVEHIFNTIL